MLLNFNVRNFDTDASIHRFMDIITSFYLNVLDEKLFLESPFLGDRFNNVIKSVVLGTMYSTVNF